LAHADAGLALTDLDTTSLSEIWGQVKTQHAAKSFPERMAIFESLLEKRDAFNYYDKKAREAYCEMLDRPTKAGRAPWAGAARAEKELRDVVYKTLFGLDLIMPNGKPLRHCVGTEIGQWGSQFFRLARAIGPNQTVEEVFDTDDKLHEFLG
jgi:hypothetical protein